MSVSGAGDGLVIPLNKRVHRAFGQLTHCVPKWTQTYVAQGKSLASVVCYAAVSGAQPPEVLLEAIEQAQTAAVS